MNNRKNTLPPTPPPKEKEVGGGVQGHVVGNPGYADATPGIPHPSVCPCPEAQFYRWTRRRVLRASARLRDRICFAIIERASTHLVPWAQRQVRDAERKSCQERVIQALALWSDALRSPRRQGSSQWWN